MQQFPAHNASRSCMAKSLTRWKEFTVQKFGDYCHVYNPFTSQFICFVAPLEGKRAEIGRITSKHAKVSQKIAEETFDITSISRPQIPEVDKTNSVMNGPVSDDQDDVDSKEGELWFDYYTSVNFLTMQCLQTLFTIELF